MFVIHVCTHMCKGVCVCVHADTEIAMLCQDPFIQATVQQGFDGLLGDLIALGV